MGLVLRVRVERRKNGVEVYWLYLPKVMYELLKKPVAFEAEMEEGRLILKPLKEVAKNNVKKEVKVNV